MSNNSLDPCIILTGKQLNYKTLALLIIHLNLSATVVEYTASEQSVAGRPRDNGLVYSGDTLKVSCNEGYEFSYNLSTITITAGINGFNGFSQCQGQH